MSSQYTAGLQQYITCCRLLEDELDVEPGETKSSLYRRIRVAEVESNMQLNAVVRANQLHSLLCIHVFVMP